MPFCAPLASARTNGELYQKKYGRRRRLLPQINFSARVYVPELGLGLALAEGVGLALSKGLGDGLGLGCDLVLLAAALFCPKELFWEPVVRVLASPCR